MQKRMLPADARPDAMTLREDDISVLIGSDFWDVATGSVPSLTPPITAMETLLRWTIQGSLRNLSQGSGAHATSLLIAIEDASERDAALEAGFTNFWGLDFLGIPDDPDGSQGNSMALELFQRAISKVGERYEVHLLIQEPGLDNGQLYLSQTVTPDSAAPLSSATRSFGLL
ncbi:hypothetical protein MRX96_031389 [Rhipicephalus microplus]